MNIAELLKEKQTLSFEVFPPKDEVPLESLRETIERLRCFSPDFISCTYGAGGLRRGRNLEVCAGIQKAGALALPHFTCIGNTRADIKKFINDYLALGIENMLALRGDYPPGWEGTGGDFAHGDELIGFLSKEFPGLCLAAAAYPENHLTAPSLEEDIRRLRSKQDQGARFIMTQLCHDVSGFSAFAEKARRAGITAPIVAGIMPALSRDALIRMTLANGCSIPAELAAIMGKYEKDPEGFRKAGMEYTVRQIHRFQKADVQGIHIYSLNKWEHITEILKASGYGDSCL
jgi:methylenetetrahydrofolate reductase (NADPH)